MTFYCRQCDLDLTPVFGDSNLSEHERQHEHEQCPIDNCQRRVTTNRRIEHEAKFHPIKCADCSSHFRSETNLKRHVARVHRGLECVLCSNSTRTRTTVAAAAVDGGRGDVSDLRDAADAGDAARDRFDSVADLRRHNLVAHDRNDLWFCQPCCACSRQFTTEKQLYEHQKQHCRKFCCDSCDKEFETLVHYNAHRSKHFGKLGACSTSTEPSLRRFHTTWNELQYEHEPWEADCDVLLRDKEDGEIRRITVNLVQKVPFEEQLEKALREIFAAVRHQTPYKLVLAFGFLLYKRKTDELWTFYVNEHLSRDPVDRRFIHQLPNVWSVHDRRDEEKIIVELKEMDFFNALQNQLDQHGYDVMVIRVTNVVAEVFPTADAAESYSNLLQAAVHDGDDNDDRTAVLEGRGGDGGEDDDDDDDDVVMDDVFDDDDDDHREVEAEDDDDDNNYVLNADRRKTRRKEKDENGERIDAYVKRCSTKRSTILYGGRVKNIRRNEDVLQKLCFFIQMAFWHLRAEKKKKPNERNGAEIERRARDYFRLYCREFGIDNDEEFTGVNVKIVDNLEYLFKTRVNVFVCTALEQNVTTTTTTIVVDVRARVEHVERSVGRRRRRANDSSLYWTRRYVTFDFEALLKNVNQSQLDAWDARVGDDVEERIIADDDDDDDDDEGGEDVLVNIPLSYAIATNFPCCDDDDDDATPNVFEREYDAQQQQQQQQEQKDESMYCERSGGDDGSKYFSLFRVARNPRRLVARFVGDLMKMADCRRKQVRTEYASILTHVERWFEERGFTCRLQSTTCDASECVTVRGGGDDDRDNAEVLMEVYKDEISLVRKLKRRLDYLPVMGFNSSGYDLPLIKKYLYDVCLHDFDISSDNFHFIKKNSKYVSMTISDEQRSGGLSFLDVMSYLAAGAYSLDTFIKAFLGGGDDDDDDDDARKSYFPYEYERLDETCMPPYESFHSTLTQSNRLEDELQAWLLKKHRRLSDHHNDDDDDDEQRPMSGHEKYKRLCRMWQKKGFRTLGDFLRDYNVKDVVPFLRALESYALQLREAGVDMFFDGISLPGLAKAILSHKIPPNTFYYLDNAEQYRTVHKSEVGGQSIIFKRSNTHPYVRGYDANALYLHSMCGGQYVGKPRHYQRLVGGVMVRRTMPPSSMRLTEERRRRDAALGSIGPIRIRERRDSREAQLFLDYVEQHVLTPRRIVLHRQKYLRLCRSEIDWLQGKYTEFFGGGELLLRAPRFFTVDGMFTDYEQHGGREQRCIIEFDGCYWHACARQASVARSLPTRRTLEIDAG
eukprot:gene21216-biopygen16244